MGPTLEETTCNFANNRWVMFLTINKFHLLEQVSLFHQLYNIQTSLNVEGCEFCSCYYNFEFDRFIAMCIIWQLKKETREKLFFSLSPERKIILCTYNLSKSVHHFTKNPKNNNQNCKQEHDSKSKICS